MNKPTIAEKIETHTPGPWTFEETTLSICRLIVSIEDVRAFQVSPESDDDHAIAYVPCDVGRKKQEANARLIAAAPELLATLRGVRAFCPVFVQDDIDALIAKAERGVR